LSVLMRISTDPLRYVETKKASAIPCRMTDAFVRGLLERHRQAPLPSSAYGPF